MHYYDDCDTPLGRLMLVIDDAGALVHVDLPNARHPLRTLGDWIRDGRRTAAVRTQFEAYFDGRRRDFDLRLAPSGTAFQQAVWTALRDIPFGTTSSYGALARRIGKPAAVRAVGAANGANPLPIVVPCHRVIGADGGLVGFGGGLPAKQWLLEHERRHVPEPAFALTP